MTSILFIRGKKAYLPEIAAYQRYLETAYPDVKTYDSNDHRDFDLKGFDVIWRFMGMDKEGAGRYVVHEYNSLSAPPLPRIKNKLKKIINKRPDRRVFLNEGVRADFGFSDGVPDAIRDMGVAQSFFEQSLKPEYDFVYAGSVHRGGEVLQAIAHFANNPKAGSLLVIGGVDPDVQEFYEGASNVTFTGAVNYDDVPGLMAKGRYGLNLIPDRYPFNRQTVTKVLEYCALGLPLVSMRYGWIEEFMAAHDGGAFWLEPDFSNLTAKAVQNYDFKVPNVESFTWDNVISQSGVFDFLKQV